MVIKTNIAMATILYQLISVKNADKTINHTGVIRVEGVNNQNEMTSVVDIIINQLRGEVRI